MDRIILDILAGAGLFGILMIGMVLAAYQIHKDQQKKDDKDECD